MHCGLQQRSDAVQDVIVDNSNKSAELATTCSISIVHTKPCYPEESMIIRKNQRHQILQT